ncbi:MAG: hypothetical protein HY505_00330 [Candidatus Yanofskybacteria bacterium]|nr:hypothetical protein [Candidatus Yanofskybacteria bacterium]
MIKFYNILIIALLISVLVLPQYVIGASGDSTYAGASLYVSPLQEDPRAGTNFTLTIKTDSLAEPINAINGRLTFNPDKLEIINVSKVGSIFNIWLEEPNFTNLEGKLSFQGGVPRPGFIGNGGTVLHIIFRAKAPGIASIVWEKAEVLAHDGKGTNVLTNLQNFNFAINEPLSPGGQKETPFFQNPLVILNIILLAVLGFLGYRHFIKSILKSHDEEIHEHEHELEKEIKHYEEEHKEQHSSGEGNS